MYKTLKPKSTSTITPNALFSTKSTNNILHQELTRYKTSSFKLNSNDFSTSLKLFKRYVQSTTKKDTLNYILQNKINQKQNKIKEDLSKLTVKSLRNQLRLYNLKVSGNKPELIERLTNYNLNHNNSTINATSHPNETKLFNEIKKSIKKSGKTDDCKTNVKKQENGNTKVKVKLIKTNSNLFLTKETANKKPELAGVDIKKFSIDKPAKILEKKLKTTKSKSTKEKSELSNENINVSDVLTNEKSSFCFPIKLELHNYKEIRFEDLPDYNLRSKEKAIIFSIVLLSTLWITFGVGIL